MKEEEYNVQKSIGRAALDRVDYMYTSVNINMLVARVII